MFLVMPVDIEWQNGIDDTARLWVGYAAVYHFHFKTEII